LKDQKPFGSVPLDALGVSGSGFGSKPFGKVPLFAVARALASSSSDLSNSSCFSTLCCSILHMCCRI